MEAGKEIEVCIDEFFQVSDGHVVAFLGLAAFVAAASVGAYLTVKQGLEIFIERELAHVGDFAGDNGTRGCSGSGGEDIALLDFILTQVGELDRTRFQDGGEQVAVVGHPLDDAFSDLDFADQRFVLELDFTQKAARRFCYVVCFAVDLGVKGATVSALSQELQLSVVCQQEFHFFLLLLLFFGPLHHYQLHLQDIVF